MSSARNDGRNCDRVWRHTGLWCAVVAMILGLGSAQALAQCAEQQKLTASDADADAFFGGAASLSGNTAVVGAFRTDCAAGIDCGAAYVFRFNGVSWVEEQKLTASDAAANDWFGVSVSLSGNTAVVGAFRTDCAAGINCGAAYVFRFNGTSWVEEQKLTASDAAADDWFGFAVSVRGDTVVAGAINDGCATGFDCGSAYVFRFNGISWDQEQKLTASGAAADDWFGVSVSLGGDTAVVGAMNDDCATGVDCGSAYVFRFNETSWVEVQKLTASDAGASDNFAISVSVSEDTAAVGAWRDDCVAGSNCGSAYVFRYNGTSWVEAQKLTASDAAASDQFGASVAVTGETAVMGARLADCAAGFACGSAYVFWFNGTSWVEDQKLTASDAGAEDGFGGSVSVDGGMAVVGAPRNDCTSEVACGSVYVFRCGPFCGDGACDPGEDLCSCSADCGLPPPSELPGSTCTDGLDNDCDSVIDSGDPDCAVPPIPVISAWGMIVVTLLLLAVGKIVFRRTVNVSGSA